MFCFLWWEFIVYLSYVCLLICWLFPAYPSFIYCLIDVQL
jgi:hypothetical protein